MKLQTQWDLSKLGKSIHDKSFQKERGIAEEKVKAFAKKWKKDKSFLTDEKKLRKALDEYNELSSLSSKEDMFLWMSLQLRTDDIALQAAIKKLSDFGHTLANSTRFFGLELGKIKLKFQKVFLKSKLLGPYRNYLRETFKEARHHLSESEEKILSLKSDVAYGNWVNMLDEFLSQAEEEIIVKDKGKFLKKFVPMETILTELSSTYPKVRASANFALSKIYQKFSAVAEKEINSVFENKKIDDELRSFERPDSSRHLAEGIESSVVDVLRDVVNKNMKLSHQFYALKSQLLQQERFHYNERNLSYGVSEVKYSYSETVAIVEKAFARIDDEFVNIFKEFTHKGYIDVEPKKGKTGGAFCLSLGIDEPVFVLLNYTGTTRDITTLAHEMGHAVHAIKAKKEISLNYHPPMATAEVASTFCEDFVFDEIISTVSENEKFILMIDRLQNKTNTIFRQIAAYNFEYELHTEFRKQGYLSQKHIGDMFNKHMKAYLGPRFNFDEVSGQGWIHWSHFRRPFYVYSYAMGLLCAQAMQSQFRENVEFISAIKEFYSTGSSLSPQEIFSNMGMDITNRTFWQEGIDEYKQLLNETKKLAKKLGKI